MGKKSILIVEDEAIVSLDLKLLLEKAGYEINRICSSSDQLFSEFENYPRPDLILMDVHIDGKLNGLESSLKVKQLYDIPVIFLTAYADKNTLDRAKDSYPYGYIIKPYDKRKLLVIIEMGLNIIELEQEVKRREELFSATFNSIADSVVVTDKSNRISFANPAARRLAGSEDLAGRDFDSVFQIEYSASRKNGLITDSNGNERTLEIKRTELSDSHAPDEGSVLILTDVTESLFLEAQLRESQKMEAVGRLAGGVAHDFNNLLTVIMGYCSLILDNSELMDSQPSLESDIKGIQTTSRKAVKLTKQLMTFSEKQIHTLRHVDLNSIIVELDKIIDRMIPDRINVDVSLTKSRTVINIDPVQLEQIIINLAVNSRDALRDNGHIAIRTEVLSTDENLNIRNGKIPPGDYVLLSVKDNGEGISPDIQSKIFEPFFTTKKGGKGIGLGLSTVYGIIQHSGGYIDLMSSPGEGTEFRIYFPWIKEALFSAKKNESKSNYDMGHESVLVVEEDDYVRSIMVRILKKKNYSVLEAGNAGEALLLCEKRGTPIDLLITDMFMPLISGEELSLRLGKRFPRIKTVYTSTVTTAKGDLGYFIQKPFDPDDFSLLVRNCLDGN